MRSSIFDYLKQALVQLAIASMRNITTCPMCLGRAAASVPVARSSASTTACVAARKNVRKKILHLLLVENVIGKSKSKRKKIKESKPTLKKKVKK